MAIFTAIMIGLGMGLAISTIARSKGYQPFPWFAYGFLIWPVALLHIWLKKNRTEAIVASAMAAVEERHFEYAGTLVGADGAAEQRAVLTMKGFKSILATDAGERWDAELQRVRWVLRSDGIVEVTLGPSTWLFRPDDGARLVQEGHALGLEMKATSS